MIKNRLREVRKNSGLSQEELSKRTGLSRTTLSKIESNEEAVVTTETIVKLAKAFDVKPSEIFLI